MANIFKNITCDNMYVEGCGINYAVFTYRGRQYDGHAIIRGLFRDYAVNMWYDSNWELCAQVDAMPKNFFQDLQKS